ncbi:PfkB family carbohydrate kinase [Polaromonas sp. P1-6]|nr:PfkB family carbohydrate kinase [Polaromonas sp. P1-6]
MSLNETAASGEHAEVVCVASWNADLISRVARPITRGETLMASAFSISPGGKGSNAAVAAARQGARGTDCTHWRRRFRAHGHGAVAG